MCWNGQTNYLDAAAWPVRYSRWNMHMVPGICELSFFKNNVPFLETPNI